MRTRPWGEALPAWTQTVRFRLAALYSLLLLVGMAIVVLGIYAGFAASTDSYPIADEVAKTGYLVKPNGKLVKLSNTAELIDFESVVNDRTLATLRTYSVISLAALPLLSISLGWWLAGRALRPVQRIANVAGEIEARDLSRRIDLQGPRDELRSLADTFDRMLERLDVAFAAQRRFLDEASHDLRNPLATMRANLEVVLRNPNATIEDFRDASRIAVRAVDRMSGIVEGLLTVARQQNAAAEHGEVDLALLVRDSVEQHQAMAADRSISLAGMENTPRVVIPGDGAMLRRALANLVENAVRLAPPSSTVRVGSGVGSDIGAGTDDGWRWLAVSDEGPGIPPAYRDRIFDRSWTTGDEEHRGLGLAIVAQVAAAHGGTVRALASGAGSTLVMWLPSTSGSALSVPTADPFTGRPTR